MTGQAVEIPWAPGANYTRIICRLGEPRPDGTDADENPDLMTQGGTVTLACTAKKIRYAEADGRSRMLTTKAWTFKVRLSDGELYNPESGNVGVKILSGSSAGVDPAGFTWTATVTPDSGESWFCTIPPTAGDTFDLVSNADVVAPSPGESTLTQRVKALEDADPGTGAYPVEQVTLTAPLAYTLPVGAPSDQVIGVVFTQDGTGGHTVTYGGAPVTVDTSAGASTLVEVWPGGTLVYPGASAPAGASSAITADDTPAAPADGESASYLVTSAVTWPAGLVWSTDPDGGVVPTITGTALVSLFTLGGVTRAILGATFPGVVVPDTTAPVAGTLAASILTDTGFTLTALGASDVGGLHAQPYSFDVGSGVFGAWQTGASSLVAGKTPGTSYTCRHKARDAAGNESVGASIVVTTTAVDVEAPVWAPTFTTGTPTETTVTATASSLASDNSGVVVYDVSYDNGSTFAGITPSDLTFTLTGLASTTYGTTQIRATDAAGNSTIASVPSYTMASPVGFTPTSLNLYAWHDASDTSTVIESGGKVVQWSDKSGNGKHLKQDVVATQPTKGDDVIAFGGTQRLDWSFLSTDGWGGPASAFIVASIPSATNAIMMRMRVDIYSDSGRIELFSNRSYNSTVRNAMIYMAGTAAADVNLVLTTSGTGTHLFGYTRTLGAIDARMDGQSIATGDGGSNWSAGWDSTVPQYVGSGFTGEIKEIVVVKQALSGTALSDLETYLKTKWAIA